MEEWRIWLYPLGFVASLFFGGRFLLQWIQSEKAHQSVVTRTFWQLSLVGNFLLFLHSLLQVQIHICLVQACNAVISWRNLNLMQRNKPPCSLTTVIVIMLASILATIAAFALQELFFKMEGGWFRVPVAPWQQQSASASLIWHLAGALGYFLFSCRFWIQWWLAERSHSSSLPLSFWWMSLVGALLSILYFIRIDDSVNLIGPLVGIIPYIRNLMLMKKTSETT